MTLSSAAAHNALIAFHRFGLGAKPGGPAHIGADPRGALRAELNAAGIALINDPKLPTYEKACIESANGFERAETGATAGDRRPHRQAHERADRLRRTAGDLLEQPLLDDGRTRSDTVRGMIGQLERDVIRRNVLGNFSDMLRRRDASIPRCSPISTMPNSIGPNSPAGKSLGRRLQRKPRARGDGTAHGRQSAAATPRTTSPHFAKILTGWSYVRGWEADGNYNGGNDSNRGQLHLPLELARARRDHACVGKNYPAEGMTQGLTCAARSRPHPATAEHIAFKLVRHFITDEPTPAMVDPLKDKFIETGGDLKAVALALLDLPEAWSAPLTKFRTPYELTIAQFRALGFRYDGRQLLGVLGAARRAPTACCGRRPRRKAIRTTRRTGSTPTA